MNKSMFFALVKESVFKGRFTTSQVAGLERILTEADRRQTNTEFLAYILATSTWEGAYTMQPITERGSRSYFNKYEPGTKIGKDLGNTQVGDGYKFRGRGDVMITGRRNYFLAGKKLGVDLIKYPDKALDPSISVQILFSGMIEGWFTGKALKDYLDGIDENDQEDMREFVGGRRVVNGTDKQIAIARLALNYEMALRLAKRAENGTVFVPPIVPDTIEDTAANPPTKPTSSPIVVPGLVLSAGAMIAVTWDWLTNVPCNLIGIFCGG